MHKHTPTDKHAPSYCASRPRTSTCPSPITTTLTLALRHNTQMTRCPRSPSPSLPLPPLVLQHLR